MGAMASQTTSLTIVYSTVYSDEDQGKHQSSASLAFVREIHRWPVNSSHKGPVTRKMFPFDDVIMVFKLHFKFRHNLLRVHICILWVCSWDRSEITIITSDHVVSWFVTPDTASGEKWLCCSFPNFINNSSLEIFDEIDAHPYEGYSFLTKRTKLTSYRIDCTAQKLLQLQ